MVCASDVGLGKKDKKFSQKNLVIIGAGPAGLELALFKPQRGTLMFQYMKSKNLLGEI